MKPTPILLALATACTPAAGPMCGPGTALRGAECVVLPVPSAGEATAPRPEHPQPQPASEPEPEPASPPDCTSSLALWPTTQMVVDGSMGLWWDADRAWVDMADRTCAADIDINRLGAPEWQVLSGPSAVVDVDDLDVGWVVGGDGLGAITPDDSTWHTVIEGLRTVRAAGSGFVALAERGDRCALVRGEAFGSPATAWLAPELCGGGLAVERATGAALVAAGDLWRVLPDGGAARVVLDAGDRVAVDPNTGGVAVGRQGLSALRVLDPDGAERWTADLRGNLVELLDLGEAGVLGALVDRPEARALVLFDADSGCPLADTEVGEALRVHAARGGGAISVVDGAGVATVFEVVAAP